MILGMVSDTVRVANCVQENPSQNLGVLNGLLARPQRLPRFLYLGALVFQYFPQAVLALRGSYGVGKERRWSVVQPVRARRWCKLLLFRNENGSDLPKTLATQERCLEASIKPVSPRAMLRKP